MAIHLFFKSTASTESVTNRLHFLAGYESGEVMLYICTSESFEERSIEGRSWQCVWRWKEHAEAGKETFWDECVEEMLIAPE